MSFSSLLDTHLVTIDRPVTTQDTSGGGVKQWTTVQTDVPCTVQQVSDRERLVFAQRNVELSHTAWFDVDYGIKRGDRVKNQATGDFYRVTDYRDVAGRGEVFQASLISWMP